MMNKSFIVLAHEYAALVGDRVVLMIKSGEFWIVDETFSSSKMEKIIKKKTSEMCLYNTESDTVEFYSR